MNFEHRRVFNNLHCFGDSTSRQFYLQDQDQVPYDGRAHDFYVAQSYLGLRHAVQHEGQYTKRLKLKEQRRTHFLILV